MRLLRPREFIAVERRAHAQLCITSPCHLRTSARSRCPKMSAKERVTMSLVSSESPHQSPVLYSIRCAMARTFIRLKVQPCCARWFSSSYVSAVEEAYASTRNARTHRPNTAQREPLKLRVLRYDLASYFVSLIVNLTIWKRPNNTSAWLKVQLTITFSIYVNAHFTYNLFLVFSLAEIKLMQKP